VTSSRYIVILLAVAVVLLSPLAASALFLTRSGELKSAGQVAKWLQKTDGIYGTALNNNAREVAFAVYKQRAPDVIVMSSSRGIDFRGEFFSRPFSCVCMMMSNIEEGIQFLDAIKEDHFPKVVIIGLDYWWFSATDDHSTVPWRGDGPAARLSRADIFAPYEWIFEGKLTVLDFLKVEIGFRNLSTMSSEPKLGVQAMKLSNGIRADGTWSLLGTASTLDFTVPIDAHMNDIVRRPELLLQERSGRYAPDQKLAEDRIAQLQLLIDGFEGSSRKVVLILLPIAPPVVEVMETTGRYQFIWQLRSRLAGMAAEYYDFFDPRTFGGSVCEFKDPHHGGNALYARMLQTILGRNPASILKDFVSYAVVSEVARRFAGKTIATIGTETAAFHEEDFFRLGCRK
jgi:hypothetical protein